MARTVRVLLFNADDTYSAELRTHLLRIPGLKIVAELDEPSLLPQAVSQFPVDLVFVHLDPSVDFVLEIMRQLLESTPGLAAFALSDQTEGDVVLRAMRAGFREYLVKPLTDEELTRAISKLDVGHVATREPGKLITMIGAAGGVGATTLAVNLAVELSHLVGKPKKVALVDLDFRYGQVATMLDLHPQFTIADLCDSPEHVDPEMINKAVVDHESGVRVLARPNNFAQADSITAAHCISVLSTLTEVMDYVVVDGPSRYDPGGQSVIDMADYNMLVLQLLVTSVRSGDRICRALSEQGFNMDRVFFIGNRLDNDPGYLDQAQVEKTLNHPFFASIPSDWKSIASSINIGQPLATQWSKSKARLAIANLAMKIHDPERATEATGNVRGGLLGRLFGGAARKGDTAIAIPAPADNAPVEPNPAETATPTP